MKETVLRKLSLFFILTTVICLLWAIGANSRKKVELQKSNTLNDKLSSLTLANTVITDDLKKAHNRLAELKFSEQSLKTAIDDYQKKSKSLEKELKGQGQTTPDFRALLEEAKILKAANIALGEELLKLGQRDTNLQAELENLKAELEAAQTKKKKKKSRKRTTNSNRESNHFDWK